MTITRKSAFALAITASLALSACGSSDKASDAISAESVEMPAEAALSGVESAAPVADPSATATPTTTEGVAANAAAAAADVAAAAGEAPAPGTLPAPSN
jgi:hypothetical protein